MAGNTESHQVPDTGTETDADRTVSDDEKTLGSFTVDEDENGSGFGLVLLTLVVGAVVFALALDLVLGISFLELFL